MRSFARTLLFAVTVLAAATGTMQARAQSKTVTDVTGGLLGVIVDTQTLASLRTFGIVGGYHGTSSDPTLPHSYRIETGQVDKSSGAGEFLAVGAYAFVSPTINMTINRFSLDTTGDMPVITGLVLINGVIQGRIPIFTLAGGNPFKNPVSAPSTRTTTADFTMNPSFVTYFNTAFGQKALTLGESGAAVTMIFTTN